MQKITNNYNVISGETPKWEKTEDGFLRCKSRVLAERILPYSVSELSDLPSDFQDDIVRMYVPLDSLHSSESLRSLEGCPIVTDDHFWMDPDSYKVHTKGSSAGSARTDGPYVEIDLLVTDKDGIEYIENMYSETGSYPEISAGYRADTIFEAGSFDGQPYDAKQTKIRYNHIAVIPKGHGRAGQDIRILNKQPLEPEKETDEMADEKGVKPETKASVRVSLKNSRKFLNTDEEGAQAYEEDSKMSEEKLTGAMDELETKNGEMEALQAEIETLKGELQAYKDKLEELLSDEAIEAKAEEMIEESDEADEIIENMADEEKKEEIMNSVKGLHGEKLHRATLEGIGLKFENMSKDGIKGAFKAQAQIAKMGKGLTKPKVVSGAKVTNAAAPGKERRVLTHLEKLGFPRKETK